MKRGRLLWSPLLPFVLLGWFVARIVTVGPTPLRIAGVVVQAIWLALAVYDWSSGGKLREWLYSDDR